MHTNIPRLDGNSSKVKLDGNAIVEFVRTLCQVIRNLNYSNWYGDFIRNQLIQIDLNDLREC